VTKVNGHDDKRWILQSEYRGRTHVVFITIEPTIVHHPSILQTTSLLVTVTSERNVGLHLQHLTLRDPTRRHVIQPHTFVRAGQTTPFPGLHETTNDQGYLYLSFCPLTIPPSVCPSSFEEQLQLSSFVHLESTIRSVKCLLLLIRPSPPTVSRRLTIIIPLAFLVVADTDHVVEE
jgi:hypothetical protein